MMPITRSDLEILLDTPEQTDYVVSAFADLTVQRRLPPLRRGRARQPRPPGRRSPSPRPRPARCSGRAHRADPPRHRRRRPRRPGPGRLQRPEPRPLPRRRAGLPGREQARARRGALRPPAAGALVRRPELPGRAGRLARAAPLRGPRRPAPSTSTAWKGGAGRDPARQAPLHLQEAVQRRLARAPAQADRGRVPQGRRRPDRRALPRGRLHRPDPARPAADDLGRPPAPAQGGRRGGRRRARRRRCAPQPKGAKDVEDDVARADGAVEGRASASGCSAS